MKEFDQNIILKGEKIYLRYLKKEDRRPLFENIYHDDEVLRSFGAEYVEDYDSFTLDRMIDRSIELQMYLMAIVIKGSDEVIGYIFQRRIPNPFENTVEVGFAIGKRYWNQGYTSEALKLMIDLFFDKGVHKVTACHFENNPASGRVMEKAGMSYEGRRFDEYYFRGAYMDTLNYYILNTGEDNGTLHDREV